MGWNNVDILILTWPLFRPRPPDGALRARVLAAAAPPRPPDQRGLQPRHQQQRRPQRVRDTVLVPSGGRQVAISAANDSSVFTITE